jgi:hypothetical protein
MKRWLFRSVAFLVALLIGVSIGAITLDRMIPFPPTLATDSESEPKGVTAPFDDRDRPYALLLMVQDGWAGFGACEYDERIKGRWLALTTGKDGTSLRERTISLDKPEHDDFGLYYSVNLENKKYVDFLVSDTGELKAGPAISIKLGDYPGGRVFASNPVQIDLSGRNYKISEIPTSGDYRRNDEVLVLEQGPIRQVLFYFDERSLGEAVSPVFGSTLHWVGDIDGDERLDFIVSNGDMNGGGESRILFISSIAKPGEMVRAYAYVHSLQKGC